MVFLIKHDVYYYKNVRLQTFMKLKTNVDYEMFNCNTYQKSENIDKYSLTKLMNQLSYI